MLVNECHLAFPCRQYASLLSKSKRNSLPTYLFVQATSLYFPHTVSTRSLLLLNFSSCACIHVALPSSFDGEDSVVMSRPDSSPLVTSLKTVVLGGVFRYATKCSVSTSAWSTWESRNDKASQIAKAERKTIRRVRHGRAEGIVFVAGWTSSSSLVLRTPLSRNTTHVACLSG